MGITIFTREELNLFWFELVSRFRSGVRSPAGFLYVSFTLIGVAWASWGIPWLNRAETSPETLGIYVIGFLITVLLDALITWKKKGNDNPYEQAIAAIFLVISLLLVIFSSYLSVKNFKLELNPPREVGAWKRWAQPLLYTCLTCAVIMSLVLSGIDPKVPIGPLDVPVGDIADRGANG